MLSILAEANGFFAWLWRTSWQASVVIGVVLLAQRVLRPYLTPRWRHALWLLVLIRLILPGSVASPMSLFSRSAMAPGMVGILEHKNQMKRRICMIAQFKKTNRWPVLAATAWVVLALVTLTNAQTSRSAGGGGSDGPPRIVSTSPQLGETDVNPALTEITITFDRDMAAGFSWTGGLPDMPPSPEGTKAKWQNKRTCVLPVKLEGARYYRVGINSTSFGILRAWTACRRSHQPFILRPKARARN